MKAGYSEDTIFSTSYLKRHSVSKSISLSSSSASEAVPMSSSSSGRYPVNSLDAGDSDMESSNNAFQDVEKIEDQDMNNGHEEEETEEEDETIKAIRQEQKKQRDHPPTIIREEFICDISFHPSEDYLAVANERGVIILYKYSNEENTIVRTNKVHKKECRDIEFNDDGSILFSVSKDKSIALTDVESGNVKGLYKDAHETSLTSVYSINENLFSTGDGDGCVKLWDLRQKSNLPIYKVKKNEDCISDMISGDDQKYLICSSEDGSITTLDLRHRKVFMLSENYDEDLNCLGVFNSNRKTKLLAGSSQGRLHLYNWHEFGLYSDLFPTNKRSINDLVVATENILVTACEDGNLRAIHLFPNRHLGIVGQHDQSVENVDICNTGQFIASSSYNSDIKFWNVQYFEDFEGVSKKHKRHNKKREMRHHLPSSNVKNVSDFFSGLR